MNRQLEEGKKPQKIIFFVCLLLIPTFKMDLHYQHHKRNKNTTPDDYNDLIKTVNNIGYTVKEISSENILDFKKWGPQIHNKSSKSSDKSDQLSISKYKYLEYTSSPKGYATVSEYIDGLVRKSFLLHKPYIRDISLPASKANINIIIFF